MEVIIESPEFDHLLKIRIDSGVRSLAAESPRLDLHGGIAPFGRRNRNLNRSFRLLAGTPRA